MDLHQKYQHQKAIILKHLQAGEKEWQDWRWHLANRISSPLDLKHFLPLMDQELALFETIRPGRRWAITPHYLAAIDWEQPADPLKLQVLPRPKQVASCFAGLAHGENRVLLPVTSVCAVYCSFCPLSGAKAVAERHLALDLLRRRIQAMALNHQLREVILTGGDALLLSDQRLEWLLKELRQLKQVRTLGITTRTMVFLPQRITDQLCNILKQYGPLNIITQINHPRELTPDSQSAIQKLVTANAAVINHPFGLQRKANFQLPLAN